MKMKNIPMSTFVASAALLASSSVIAYDYSGLYILGGAGYGVVEDAQFSEHHDLNDLKSESNLVWRAGIGTWISSNIGIEANWHGMKGTDDTASTVIGGDTFTSKLEVSRLNFFDLTAIGRCFLAEKVSVFGRAGPAYASIKREGTSYMNGEVIGGGREDNGGVGMAVGAGFQYDFTPAIGARVEATTIQAANNNDLYALTGNLVVNFGAFM